MILEGNVPPLARPEFRLGPLDRRTRMDRMLLLLKPQPARQRALDDLVAAQQDPRSPLYHCWIAPAQYGELYGATDADLARVTSWLAGEGFAIDEVSPSRRLIVFSGSAAQVESAFHPRMTLYRAAGTVHIANADDPQIPAALAGVVGGVVSLSDFRHRSEIAAQKRVGSGEAAATAASTGQKPPLQSLFNSGTSHYLFPADFATIYNLNPVYSAGTSGAGTAIAIAARSNINLGDVAAFRSAAGLPGNAPAVIFAGADPGLIAGDQDEATLDVEWSGAVAPSANVQLVTAASTSATDGVDLAAEYIVNHALAPVVSVSYGSCEREMGTTELAFYNSLWEQAASEGLSVFVASGDAGAAGCSAGSDATGTGAAVNGLCSSPYATCVGGTELNEGGNPGQYWEAANGAQQNSALQYIPEVVWNESASNGGSGMWASGGGASMVYPQPAWQAGMSGAGTAGGMRAVPDVSLAAAAHDGYIIYENGSYRAVSGTSAAAPAFAAIMALAINRQGAAGQGTANPRLYLLAGSELDPFHATPEGDNSVPGVPGFAANGAPYSLATGLGSVDGWLLVSGWGAATGQPSLDLNAAADAMILTGGSGSIALTAVTGGPFAGQIVFTVAGLPDGVTAEWSGNPATMAAGSSSAPVTLTLLTSQRAAPGGYSVVVTATGGGLSAARRLTVTIPRPAACRYGLLNSRCDSRVTINGPRL